MIPAAAQGALAYLETRGDAMLEFLRRLVGTPSITVEMGERAIAALVAAQTADLGLDPPEWRHLDPRHPNLLYEIRGPRPGPTLILNGHLDTQPVGEAAAWTHDPFAAEIAGGRLYGLGATDMKGAVAAMVFAFAALAASGALLRGGVRLILVANEENGGRFGADWLARQGLLRGDGCVIGEPAGVQKDWEAIYAGQRGQSGLWVRVGGQRMHSGVAASLGAANAATRMARLICALDRDLLITRSGDPSGAAAQATIGVLVRCGDAWGVNPGLAEFGIDVRTVPGMARDDVARGIEAALAAARSAHPEIPTSWRFAEPPQDWIAPTALPGDSPLVRAASGAAADILGAAPPLGLYPATTDASAFAGLAGVQTIAALGPGRISLAHRPDEYVEVDAVVAAARMYVVLAVRYLGGE